MKIILAGLLGLVVMVPLATQAAQAQSRVHISDLKFHVASSAAEMKAVCGASALETFGCFFYGTNDLWVRSDISDLNFFTLTVRHEMGHFFSQNITDWSYLRSSTQEEQDSLAAYLRQHGYTEEQIFAQTESIVSENAANKFAEWSVNHSSVPKELQKVFEDAIR